MFYDIIRKTDENVIIALQKHIISKEKISDENMIEADINEDGIVNVLDVIFMRRKLIEI